MTTPDDERERDRPTDELATRPSGLPAVEERGATHVEDRVIRKIAEEAARGVDHAAAPGRRLLGVSVSEPDPDGDVTVKVRRYDEDLADVSVTMAVPWPRSVLEASEEIRRRVAGDVQRYTGVTVASVDVDVPVLSRPSRPPRVR